MKLDKAIELLELSSSHPEDIHARDLKDAQELGVEALKRVWDMRISPCTTADELLPGETKD